MGFVPLFHRLKVPDGSAIARAIDYSLSRWAALTRYIDTGDLPADNNRVENLIRPIACDARGYASAGARTQSALSRTWNTLPSGS